MSRALAAALAGALALTTHLARAEVQEEHAHDPYPVHMAPGRTLRQALHDATPIAVEGRRFHGYTHWNVRWNFWWNNDASGGCRITRVSTRLRTRIQMPELRAGSTEQQARFARYAQALHQHEQGHVQFGRAAAQAIDRGIAALPEAPDCATLERDANALGQRLLKEHIAQERAYDRNTGHGATEGVQID
jgi:predicted secreted Zn-dependent protease